MTIHARDTTYLFFLLGWRPISSVMFYRVRNNLARKKGDGKEKPNRHLHLFADNGPPPSICTITEISARLLTGRVKIVSSHSTMNWVRVKKIPTVFQPTLLTIFFSASLSFASIKQTAKHRGVKEEEDETDRIRRFVVGPVVVIRCRSWSTVGNNNNGNKHHLTNLHLSN
jgi:hypothetical protein